MCAINGSQNRYDTMITNTQNLDKKTKDIESDDDPWKPSKEVIGTFPLGFIQDRNQPSWDTVSKRAEL